MYTWSESMPVPETTRDRDRSRTVTVTVRPGGVGSKWRLVALRQQRQQLEPRYFKLTGSTTVTV
eukprot:3203668-Rhodomonas_salina.3